jgi:hypothetical protein
MNREIVYVRRKLDGVVLDIPKSHLEETLKRKTGDGVLEFEYVGSELDSRHELEELFKDEKLDDPEIDTPNNETDEVPVAEFPCPLCDFVGKSETSLKAHQNKKHK